jgi:penicillin amidase
MPFFVLPGDGSAEWDGDLDPKWLPHDYDTPRGFVVTANNDPVGLTDGNDPLSGPMVDGRPLYLGARYDPGVRAGRITTRLNAQPAWDRDSVPKVQADSYSGLGSRLSPKVVAALAALTEEIKTPGTHPDLTALAATVDAAHAAAIDDARARLAAWSFETPAASDEEMPDAAAIADSAATSIWNAFFARLIAGALSDELAVLGTQPGDDQLYKLLTRMILTPATLKSGVVAASGESRLWDDLSTPGVTESAAYQIGKAMLAALDYLATRIGSTDPTTWRWGKLHHLIAEGLLPLDAIRLPPPNDPLFPDGFPRHGDNLAVDACNTGSSQTDFDYHDGPAIRFVAELDPQTGPRARNNLPGGEVFDPNSPHFRDQMERWRKNDAFDLWFTDADVVANAQSRTRFMPP